MPDITMCTGENCPLKNKCYRYTAVENEYQSFFAIPPINKYTCIYFWDNKSYKKILFVGDKPPKNSKAKNAFVDAKCRTRLLEWIRETLKRVPFGYQLCNRVDDNFDRLVEIQVITGSPIVALGNEASKALSGVTHFKLPHPSGRNRQLNNKKFIKTKLKDCEKWIFSFHALRTHVKSR